MKANILIISVLLAVVLLGCKQSNTTSKQTETTQAEDYFEKYKLKDTVNLYENGTFHEYELLPHITPQSSEQLDSLLSANFEYKYLNKGLFTKLLEQYLSDSLLFYGEMLLLQKSHIVTSPKSGKFKLYSYDERTGGTWSNYKTFIQYEDENGVLAYKEWVYAYGNGPNYEVLGSFDDKGMEYCIIDEWHRLNTVDRHRSLWVATIDNAGLMNPTLDFFPLKELTSGGIWQIDRENKCIYNSYKRVLERTDSITREISFIEFAPQILQLLIKSE